MRNKISVRSMVICALFVVMLSLGAIVIGYEKANDKVQFSSGESSDSGSVFTVTYYVSDSSGWEIYKTEYVSSGYATESSLNPADYGYTSFLGWYTTQTYDPSNTLTDRFDFNNQITGNISLYAQFSDKYLVTFTDKDGSIFKTMLCNPSESISSSTLTSIAKNLSPPSGKIFDHWYYGSSTVVTGSIVVNSNLDIKPSFVTAYYVVFVSSGTQVDPQIIATGNLATKPTDPTRSGYTFKYWSLTDGGSEYSFSTSVTSNTVLYAVWTANTVQYEVAYWFETANAITVAYDSSNPNSKYFDNGNFSYYGSSATKYAAAGSTITFTESNVNYSITGGKFLRSDTIVVSGTGTSVVNVYFYRVSYTYTFDISTYSGSGTFTSTMVWNGVTYTSGGSAYSFTAKLDQDISGLWPCLNDSANNIIASVKSGGWSGSTTTYYFIGWDPDFSSSTFVTKRFTLTTDMIPVDGKNGSVVALWSSTPTLRYVNYWFEVVDGNTYGKETTTYNNTSYYLSSYTQSYYTSSNSLNPKNITGLTYIGGGSSGNTSDFYYNYNTYVYTLNYMGAGTNSVTSLKYTQSLIEPQDPVYSGYVFQGWYTSATFAGDAYDFTNAKMPNNNLTLYAKWTINGHIVTLVFDNGTTTTAPINSNGTADLTSYYQVGTLYNTGSVPGDSDYYGIFQGWSWDVSTGDGSTIRVMYYDEIVVTKDITLYPVWKTADFTVSYTDGTTTVNDSNHYKYGVTVMAGQYPSGLKTPDTGKVFVGWSMTVGSNTVRVYPGNTFVITADTVLSAVYVSESLAVKVVLHSGDNSAGGTQSVSFYIQKNGTYTLPDSSGLFSYTGHTASGYWKDSSGNQYNFGRVLTTTEIANLISGNKIDFYALWTANTYAVSFDGNGYTSGSMTNQSFTYDVYQNLTSNGYSRTGYTFSGWSTTPNGAVVYANGANVGNLASVNGDTVKLYAVWHVNSYNVTIDLKGGSAVPIGSGWSSSSSGYTKSFNYGTSIASIISDFGSSPTKTGYTFTSWYPNTGTSGTSTIITALWKANEYAVSFDGNGYTSGSMTNQSLTYDAYQNLTSNGYSRTGYTFSGWSTTPNGAVVYANGANVGNLTSVYDGVVILYAHWTVNEYTISFDSNGGSAVADITQDYGTSVSAPADPTRTGYTFSGWYDGSAAYTFTTMPAEDVDLTAHWTVNEYTISFDSNGGSAVADITQDYGTSVSAPADPTRTGYTFSGWYDGSAAYTFTTMPAEDVDLTAHWTVNEYTISFDSNGGSAVADITQDYGTSVSAPADPTRTGYTFSGWYDGSAAYTFTTMPAEDVDLTAHWTVNEYTISFDSNGGSAVADITQDYGTSVSAPADPTRTGYTFSGWYDGSAAYTFTTMPAEDVDLTAHWTVNEYTISFDSNGGSAVADITQDYGTSVSAPADPTRTGYTFSGWYDGSAAYTFTTMPAEDVDLTAHWTVNEYTISFDSNGGSAVADITQDYGTSVSAPADPTRTGYTFSGWYDGSAAYTFTTMPAEDVDLTAHWTVNEYTISFDSNGGSAVADITQDYGTSVSAPADPTRTGYTFSGWYDGSAAYTFTTMPAEDVDLTAHWTVNEYTISFDSNGGSAVADITQDYGTSVSAPADPTRTGYTFSGWYDGSAAYTFTTMPAEDVDLTAHWTVNEYTISFDSNGGSAVADITQDYGTSVSAPADPTRTGYTFSGWYDGSAAYTFTTMPAEDVDLTAHWTVNEYTISFDSNGGSAVADITQDYGTSVSAPADPTRTGYTFSGWYDGSAAYTFTTMPAEDVDLTAHWTVNEYTISFDSNGGSAVADITQDYGTSVSAPADPTRTGYTFSGWYDGSAAYTFTTMPAEDVDLTAHWTVNEYTISFDSNGGSAVADITQDYGTSVSAPADPTRTGYTFSGWYDGSAAYTFTTMPAEDVDLTAHWTVNEYTISFDSNGGSAVADITQDYGTSVSAPADPTRTGYTFSGWYDGSAAYTFTTMPAEDVDLTAHWTVNEYTISFDSNGGSAVADITQDYGTSVSAPADPTRTGYTFSGWYDGSAAYTFTTMPAEDVDLTAHWTVNEYTISFDSNGGSAVADITQDYGTSVSAPADPTRTGYTFSGWYDGSAAYTFTTMPAEDVDLTAHWTVNEYTISFDSNGGSAVADITQDYGTSVSAPADPTRTGYTFSGWYDGSAAYTFTTMPAEDVDLTAHWTVNEYTISFDSNGGSAVADITQDYGTSVSAPADPTRTGYTFSGWYDGSAAYTFTTMPAEDVDLTAHWTVNEYTISFDSNGGSAVADITQDYGTSVSAPADPTRTGYTFSGWYDGSAAYTFTTMPAEDVDLTAHWTVNEYTISFDSNGGSAVADITQDYGTSVSAPADPTRTGYTFSGWYDGSAAYTFTTMPAEDVDLTAHWTVNEYTISFDSNGGSAVADITQDYGTSVSAPADPTRTGYTFSGWYDGSAAYTFTTMPAEDVDLTAHWTVNEYTISFDSNGGSAVADITQDYGTSVSAPADPTRTGYTFSGWYDGSAAYTFTTMPAEDVDLTAHWTVNEYTISFDSNGGSAVADITQDYGTSVSAPADPTRTGYTFSGWYDGSAAYTFTTMPAEDVDLTAHWTVNEYTISFDSNGGSAVADITQDYGTSVSAPADPTRTGYTFSGWYDGSAAYTFTTMPAEDVDLTAHWTVNEYTISFDSNGGSAVADITQDYGTSVSAPADPTRTGYTFSGWYDGSAAYTFTTMPAEDVDLTAHWTVNEYTISFDSNGGSAVADITQDYGTSVSAPADPTRTGYTFSGWYDGSAAYTFTTMPAEDVDLTAHWTVNEYTISFDSNGGSAVADITQDYGTSVSAPADPTRTGYTFSGWYDGSAAYTFTTMPAEDVDLTAHWTVNEYTISFDSNGGSAVADITQDYGTSVSAPADPTRTGYTFSGWYDGSAAYTFTTMPAEDVDLTAHWTVNEYTISFDSNGGSAVADITQDYGTSVSAPADPTRTGYTFSGWYDGSAAYTFTTMPAEDVDLTAHWTVNEYTISFDSNGGSAVADITQDYGTSVSAPADPTRTGYTFSGWYDGSAAYTFTTMPAEDVDLTAHWTVNEYTISFDSNGGSAVADITQDYGTSVSAPADPTRTGYTFSGWYDGSAAYTFTTMPAEDVDLTAHWTVNEYTISFDSNGGSAVADITQDYGTSVSAPADPTRTGYTFSGWYDGSAAYTFTTMPAEDVDLTAHWTVNEYTISFDSNGGSAVADITQDYGTSVSAPADPTRTGYTFSGWYDGSAAYTFTTMPAEDVDLTAHWTVNEYTISFDSNGGSAVADITQDYGTSVSAPADPTRTGYTFSGWYDGSAAYTFTTMPAEDVDLTAHWTVNEYTISFDSNGGSAVADITQDYGTSVSAPADPTRTGYTFSGWYDGSAAYTFTTMPAEDVDLTAHWTVNEYTISFDSNGGSAVADITQDYGTSVSAPADPTRTGYTFSGWYDGSAAYTFTTMPAEDVDLTAHWTVNEYTISFDSNGGSAVADITQDYGTSVSAPADPTRTGYTFSGWYDGSAAYTFTTMPAEDVDLTAHWTVNEYTISFDSNGGSAVADITQDYGTSVSAPADPTRTGYTFSGWYDGSAAYTFTTMPAEDVDLTAHWTVNEYTISFDSNGGSAVADITQDYGTSVSAPADPTRTGYTFSGWYDGSAAYTFTTMPAEDVDLTAHWTVNEYTISFDSNGGSAVADITQDYGTSVSAPADPTRTGYTFSGWYDGSAAYTFTTMPAEDVDLTAHWTVNEYTISFDSNGGSAVADITQDYGTSVSAPADPTRTGYTFSGWYDGSAAYTFTTMPAEDVDLTAHWTVNEYTISFDSNGGSAVADITQDYGTSVSAPADPTRTGYTFSGWYDGSAAYTFTTMPAEDVDLTAHWTVNEYTISFDSNGGSAVADITQDYGTSVSAPADPTRTGYTFSGWYDGSAAYTFTTMPAEDVDLTAHWTVNEYTISFDSNGGSAVADITQDYGTSVSAPADPTRTGYTFSGWYDGSAAYTFTTMPAEDVDLTAHWTVNEYTISFDSNGGSAVADITQDYGTSVSAPADPTRTGYTFSGWYDGSAAYTFTTMPAEDVDLTAHWTVNEYTISFDSNGGSAVADITQDYGTSVSAPADPTRTGYTFSGWYDGSAAYTFTTMPAEDVDLTAHWTVNEYTISFDSNGGSAVADITQDYGTSVSAPADPTRTGYTFSGWYDGSAAYTFTTMPAEDVDLTAHWTVNEYTISFDSNGGSAVADITQDYGTSVSAPADPTRTGYTFSGWYDGSAAYTFTTMPAEDVDLTAHWTVNEYTISFDSNGGSAVADITQDYGTSVSAPADPTRTGYTFSGWYDGSAAYTFTTMPAEDVDLTAHWTVNEYTISFTDGGSGFPVPSKVTLTYSELSAYRLPSPIVQEGYTFSGWYDGTHKVTRLTESMFTNGKLTLVGKWIMDEYTVSVTSENVSVSGVNDGDAYPYGTQVSFTAVPIEGYSDVIVRVSVGGGEYYTLTDVNGIYYLTITDDTVIAVSASIETYTVETDYDAEVISVTGVPSTGTVSYGDSLIVGITSIVTVSAIHVTVTMGGEQMDAFSYSDGSLIAGTVTIPYVTGDVTITITYDVPIDQPTSEKGFPWWILIAAIILIGLILFFLFYKRRKLIFDEDQFTVMINGTMAESGSKIHKGDSLVIQAKKQSGYGVSKATGSNGAFVVEGRFGNVVVSTTE